MDKLSLVVSAGYETRINCGRSSPIYTLMESTIVMKTPSPNRYKMYCMVGGRMWDMRHTLSLVVTQCSRLVNR